MRTAGGRPNGLSTWGRVREIRSARRYCCQAPLVLQCVLNSHAMGNPSLLGEFEYLLITAVATLGEAAYGVSIRAEIESTTGRKCSLGALYTTLDRLEEKGLITTRMSGATAERGGRSKRMVRVTPKGVQAASAFFDAIVRASRRAPWATA